MTINLSNDSVLLIERWNLKGKRLDVATRNSRLASRGANLRLDEVTARTR